MASNEYLIDRFDDLGQQFRSASVLIESLCEFATNNKQRKAIVQFQRKLIYLEKVDLKILKEAMVK